MSVSQPGQRFSNTRKIQLPTINLTELDAEAIGHDLGLGKAADVVACKPWLEKALEEALNDVTGEYTSVQEDKPKTAASASK